MAPGYVYILINPSMPGFIKIGKTLRDSHERARKLWTTGIPTPFQVAFEIFSEEHDKLESLVHQELADFRVSGKREFFQFPLDRAIKLLQKLNSLPTHKESILVAEDITDRLFLKYPNYLKPNIVSVRIVQPGDRVWLEITEETLGCLKNQVIKRTDLGFISSEPYEEEEYFDPSEDASTNANKFVDDFDPYSIAMITDLFHEEACRKIIALESQSFRVDIAK